MPEHEVPIRDAGALFHIAEPERHRQARPRRPGWGVGIDLGTTHSLVAVAPNGASPRALADDEGESLLPSVVSYAKAEVEVGRRARAEAVASPTRVIGSAKRFMGRAPADLHIEHPYAIAQHDAQGEPARVIRMDVGEGRLVSPVEVSAEILGSLRRRAERELGGELDGVVITVPAYFDDAQRQATRDAGRLAGLRVYRLLAEPTAAALAYGLDRAQEGLFAVYDLGGGTFDVSVLRLHEGVFQVLATGGDSALGGDDFDRAIARVLFAQAGVVAPTPTQLQEATSVARWAKEQLSATDTVRVSLAHSGVADLPFTRAQLDELVAPAIARTIRICRAVLTDAGVELADLAGVVLVGGSTRMPRVRAEVERAFGRAPLCDIDPDRVVAYGAAIQADILSGGAREGVTLLDVVPLSLGIETMGGIVERIIPRNATIPISARQTFTNYSERQTAMSINVVQGERELAQDCRSLARFELRGIPRLPASMARIEVTFELDADALLTVTARELMTGTKQTVEVLPTYGLSTDEVDRLIEESLDHARADIHARSRAEARVELGRVILAIQTALTGLDEGAGLLGPDERERIDDALRAADEAMADPELDSDRIAAARKELERTSEGFARRRMESALQAGMGGHTLAEIEGALADEDELARRRAPEQAETIEREP